MQIENFTLARSQVLYRMVCGAWLARAVIALGIAAALAGCGGGGAAEQAARTPGVATIGAAGGTVTDDAGAQIVFPKDALPAEITVRIAKDSTGAPLLPQGLAAAGNTYVITPHGGEFAQAVEVRIPAPNVTLQPNQELKLAKAQPGGEWVVLGDSALTGGVLSAQVSSFSFFMPVTVTYLLPIAQREPFGMVGFSLTCGQGPCDQLMESPASPVYTVTTNNGQLPTGCSPGTLALQNNSDAFSPAGPAVSVPLSGGSGALGAIPRGPSSVQLFVLSLRCGFGTGTTWQTTLGLASLNWRVQPQGGRVEVLRAPAQLDVVAGLGANLDVILSGPAFGSQTAGASASFVPPTATNRAIVDWQRSDDSGASWRTIARSYQDEANPNPVSGGFAWQYWGVRHGFTAAAADQGALIRVQACYTPPDLPALPCVTGPATRLNVLQQSALPAIVEAPRSVLVRTGQTASLSATAGGAPTPTLQWQTRAANANGAWANVSSGTGGSTGNYTTAVLGTAGNGTQYRVVATNALGSAESPPVTVSVSDLDVAPAVTTQPASLNVSAGNDAAFAIAARGTEALSYQWQFNGVPISGANSPVLRLAAVNAGQAGAYSVTVTNGAGSAISDTAVLAVSAGTPAAVAPTIVTQPVSVLVNAGNTATFAVGASGSGTLNYQWLRNGQPVAGATAAYYSIAQAAVGDAATYAVQVNNGVGPGVTSFNVVLTVNPSAQPAAVTIGVQPAPQVQTPGGSATFAVAVSGSGPIAYQWLKNGTPIGGATDAVLTLSSVTGADMANYSVTVGNVLGSITSNAASLTVLGAPIIGNQPANATASEGSSATFAVSASGNGLRYQWTRNSVGIAGATSASYTTPVLTLADSGAVYGVIVYNGAGLVFSSGAVLTVTPAGLQRTTLASATSAGGVPDNASGRPSLSSNGRRIAFVSEGTNLLAGGTVAGGAYVHDLDAGTTVQVNRTLAGAASSRRVDAFMKISGNGRYVVFSSDDPNLVADDTNGGTDVFVRDLQLGSTVRVNLRSDGAQVDANGNGTAVDISTDGRFVLFQSGTDLTGGGSPLPNGYRWFVRDMQLGTLFSIPDFDGFNGAVLSGDGRFASVLTVEAGQYLVRLAEIGVGVRTVLSILAGDGYVGGRPALSQDGRYLAFLFRSTSLLGGAAATANQIGLVDTQAPNPATTLELVSRTAGGVPGDGSSSDIQLSADGRFVLFSSTAPALTEGVGQPCCGPAVVVRDRVANTTRVASRDVNGSVIAPTGFVPALSSDGGTVAFDAEIAIVLGGGALRGGQVFVAPRP